MEADEGIQVEQIEVEDLCISVSFQCVGLCIEAPLTIFTAAVAGRVGDIDKRQRNALEIAAVSFNMLFTFQGC